MTTSTKTSFNSVFALSASSVAVASVLLISGCSSSPNLSKEVSSPASEPSVADSGQPKEVATADTDFAAADSVQSATKDERLGTKWGDDVDSKVTIVDLRRVSENPVEQMQVFYADKVYAGRTLNSMSMLAGKVDFSIATDNGDLPIFRNSNKYYVRGQAGQAYQLVYHNNSANTYEVVTSVDGLDVLDGSEASRYNRGYVLSPHENLVIEGFRKNEDAVASFIFSKPDDSYAANSEEGSINNTGVIGTVFYELYDPNKPNSSQPQAFPADNGFAKPPK